MTTRLLSSISRNIMRAIQVSEFGGPEVLKVAEVPVPQFTEQQVLVRHHAFGINPVDTYTRTGTHTVKPALPYIPGWDGAGVVEEVGSSVTGFKKGDRVFTMRTTTGSYAEFAVAESHLLGHLHDSVTYAQGACIGVPYCTAYRALVTRCHVRAGESLLVHGASGAVGLAAVQFGRAMGLTVYGTAGTDEGLELVKSNGAHHVFNHRSKTYCEDIMKCTAGKGIDVILEMLANVNLESDLQLAASRGRIAIIGSRAGTEITPRYTMTKELTIHGIMLPGATKEEWVEMAAAVYAGAEQGWLRPVVGAVYPLERCGDAHRDVIEHSGGSKGKIVVQL